MLDNKWIHGTVHFELPPLPHLYRTLPGIKPVPLVLDPEIGEEIVLLVTEPKAQICVFADCEKIEFYLRSGLVTTSQGPVFWMLFSFPGLLAGQTIAYENSINPKDETQTAIYRRLAGQKYWHVIMADDSGAVMNFFEFENSYGLDRALESAVEVSADLQVSNFLGAKAEYENTYSIDHLLKL
jgi:hypothetical protein